jgi:hypothetical protein
MITELLSQRLPVLGVVYPSSQAAGTAATAAIDLSQARQIEFLVIVGTIGASATVDFQVTGSATSGGTYTAISGTSITQITASSKIAKVVVRVDQLNALGLGYNFIKGSITVGTAATGTCVIALGGDSTYEPASQFDLAAVSQTVIL